MSPDAAHGVAPSPAAAAAAPAAGTRPAADREKILALSRRVGSALLGAPERKACVQEVLGLPCAQWDAASATFTALPDACVLEALDVALDDTDVVAAKPLEVHLRQSFGCKPEQLHHIMKHLLQRQSDDRPRADALQSHPFLVTHYRTMLVDWLVDVFLGWRQRYQTTHRAVVMVDRIFSTNATFVPNDVQLYGTTCLLLACKMEEVEQKQIEKFASLTDGAYTSDAIQQCEDRAVRMLNYTFNDVTICDFVLCYLQMLRLDTHQRIGQQSRLLSLIALHDLDLVAELPSLVGFSCIVLAVGWDSFWQSRWAGWMTEYYFFTEEQTRTCVTRLRSLHADYMARTLTGDLAYPLRNPVLGLAVLPFADGTMPPQHNRAPPPMQPMPPQQQQQQQQPQPHPHSQHHHQQQQQQQQHHLQAQVQAPQHHHQQQQHQQPPQQQQVLQHQQAPPLVQADVQYP